MSFLEARAAWRKLTFDEQVAWFAADAKSSGQEEPSSATLDPVVRDAVLACPHRGAEGGLVLLEDEKSCCGGGAERTSCSAGKGERPGRVTLRECLACKT
jgi:hypothetical protein